MNNTILKAKSTFLDGLIMDFSPDNTKSTCLTSALNATLLTFNGNELALQNDMGNGRVETAYLPEGYIPVGTCEFGDIIYIVSYNPLTNKSLIGCFPSPERNISSDELDESANVSLSSYDFIDDNGVVKATSVKKVLMKKNLNPGDKYIIFTKDKGSNGLFDEPHITDVGNTSHIYGNFPKLLKIHIVSIDDSNKVDYLDSTIKWYDKPDKDYFINNLNPNLENTSPDIDSYRNLLSSGYSVFLSKVSGKLALLIELEKIDTFSCTNNIYKVGDPVVKEVEGKKVTFQLYDVYFNVNWGTSNNNINPSSICLYNLKWTGLNDKFAGQYLLWEKEGDKYILNKEATGILLDFPVKSFLEDKKNYYNAEISRCYLQESSISYNDFLQSQSYDVKLNNSLDIIKIKLYINYSPEEDEDYTTLSSGIRDYDGNEFKIYEEELSSLINCNVAINKVNINKDNSGIPIQGSYYINAYNSEIIQELRKYYTSYKNTDLEIKPFLINDDIINNYFNYPVIKKFASFMIPISLEDNLIPDITNLIYNYELTPVMPYGILPDLKLSGYINFSKIGSGEINLTLWKYYNTENTSTLTFGLDILAELNMGVAGVVLEFIDNQGVVASYTLNNNTSYSGIFTDLIPLNNSFQNYKFSNRDINGKLIYHAGLQISEESENMVYLPSSNIEDYTEYLENDRWIIFDSSQYSLVKVNPSGKNLDGYYTAIAKNSNGEYVTVRTKKVSYYTNDSGIIYSNFLYLVKITVLYCNKDALDNYDTLDLSRYKTFYRWFWTNTMFNDKYYNTEDFESLPFELNMDIAPTYSSNTNYEEVGPVNKFTSNELDTEDLSNNFGTIYQEIKGDDNINIKVNLGLQNTYNTFSLQNSLLDGIQVSIYKGDSYIEQSESTITSVNGKYQKEYDLLYPNRAFSREEKPDLSNTNWDKNSYKNLYNWLSLVIKNELDYKGEDFEYISYDNQNKEVTLENKYITILGDLNTSISYNALNFSNYYKYAVINNLTLPLYKPLVHDIDSAKKYGFEVHLDRMLVIKNVINLTGGDIINGNPMWVMKGSILSLIPNTITFSPTEFINGEIFETSIKDRFDGRLSETLIEPGFCIIRFYDYLYGLHSFGNTLTNAYILGSPTNDTKSTLVYTYNRYTTYFEIYGNVKDLITVEFNGLYTPVLTWDYNPYFVAYIDQNKDIYLINNVYKIYNDLLSVEPGDTGWGGVFDISYKILDILTLIWAKTEETCTLKSTPTVEDIVYLKPYDVVYTYDLIYGTNLEVLNNSYITIQNIRYNEYLEAILYQYDQEINNSNIELNLYNVLKNCPISFKFTTSEIGSLQETNYSYNSFFKVLGSSVPKIVPVYLSNNSSDLYYFDWVKNEYVAYLTGTISTLIYNSPYMLDEDNNITINTSNTNVYNYFPFNLGFTYENNTLYTIPREDCLATIALSYLNNNRVKDLEYIRWNSIYKNIRLTNTNTFFNYP